MIITLNENVDEILVTDDNHVVLMQISRKEFNYSKTRDLINLIFEQIANTIDFNSGLGTTIIKINEDSESTEEY